MIKVGDWYYRFTKNEAGNAGSDVFSEKHTQPARHQHRQLDAGRARRSAAARGWPTRATRARWCSRPTRATRPAPSSSTSGRTATPTAAATSSRAAPDIEAPDVDAQDAAVHQHRHRAPRHRHAARAARVEPHPRHRRTRTSPPRPSSRCRRRRSRRARPSSPRRRCARRTATRSAAGSASPRPGWEETVYLGRRRAPRSPCPGTPARGAQAVTAEYLGHEFLTASQDGRVGHCAHDPRRVGAPVGGTVPATLALTLGAPASFGAVHARASAKEYTASTTATVTSTAGDAALSVSAATLANGAFRLAQPVVGHAGEDGVDRAGQQRHVRDRVQAVDRRDGAAAHRRPTARTSRSRSPPRSRRRESAPGRLVRPGAAAATGSRCARSTSWEERARSRASRRRRARGGW